MSAKLDSLLERIDRRLDKQQAVASDTDTALLRDRLSGAFKERIEVALIVDDYRDGYAIYVPLKHVSAAGLRFVESVGSARVLGDGHQFGTLRVLAGSQHAATNAANRVAKFLGEGWLVELDAFDPDTHAPEVAIFRAYRR